MINQSLGLGPAKDASDISSDTLGGFDRPSGFNLSKRPQNSQALYLADRGFPKGWIEVSLETVAYPLGV
ncbi:hypothetical protein N5J77_29145 [Sphingobium yanoikuyae]|uniref:Uncharacterized protein n=1 Tax=Sphingobium yanoikuyae TaxID=13690 RepID=A0AA42X4D9_SPHYA|nr:hypothetical protein [Sphingobium yanoikuyae]MDH2135199.1 hypothetical protein [Sphingobium yanoikuyae]MDH2170540.1 hypothetical protein [Sphingobium yanoikuyae]